MDDGTGEHHRRTALGLDALANHEQLHVHRFADTAAAQDAQWFDAADYLHRAQEWHTYTTPVGYMREGNTVIILTRRFRKWWRNLVVSNFVDMPLNPSASRH